MKKLFSLCFFFFWMIGFTQPKDNFDNIDKKMAAIPSIDSQSTSSIARFVGLNFKSENDKIRAIFYWIATNISYDVENMVPKVIDLDMNKCIEKTIKIRKGVCMNYAEVFNDIANKAGVECVVIDGYTRQNGKIDVLPHAWCGAKINGLWYVFDPTWGSGHVNNAVYTKKLNNKFFKINPEKSIETHMPFDFLWQFLNYPISNVEFINGFFTMDKKKPLFDFMEAIENQKKISYLDKLTTSLERIERNGLKNNMIIEKFENKKKEIDVLNKNKNSDDYNKIVYDYNQGIQFFNDYINYKNKQFRPVFPDKDIKDMIVAPKNKFENCIKNLSLISSGNADALKKTIQDVLLRVNEEDAFVTKYIATPKPKRLALFYTRVVK